MSACSTCGINKETPDFVLHAYTGPGELPTTEVFCDGDCLAQYVRRHEDIPSCPLNNPLCLQVRA